MSSANNLSGGRDPTLEHLGSRMVQKQNAERRRKFQLENANKLFERQVGEQRLANEKEFFDIEARVTPFMMANPLTQMSPAGKPNVAMFMHNMDDGWKQNKWNPAWVPVSNQEFSDLIHSSKDAIPRNQIRNKFVRAKGHSGGRVFLVRYSDLKRFRNKEMHTMEANIRIKEVMEGMRKLIKQLAPDMLVSHEKARRALQSDSLDPTKKRQLREYIEQMGQVISIFYKPQKGSGCANSQDRFEREGGKPRNLKRIDEIATETERVTDKHQKELPALYRGLDGQLHEVCVAADTVDEQGRNYLESRFPGVYHDNAAVVDLLKKKPLKDTDGSDMLAHDVLRSAAFCVQQGGGDDKRCGSTSPTDYVLSNEQRIPGNMCRFEKNKTGSDEFDEYCEPRWLKSADPKWRQLYYSSMVPNELNEIHRAKLEERNNYRNLPVAERKRARKMKKALRFTKGSERSIADRMRQTRISRN